MSVGILGSGFGLYGYLPALITGLGQRRVAMPVRYRSKLLHRPVERQFDDHVDWLERDEDVLAAVTTLVLARRPADQVEWVQRALIHANIANLVLEKPIGPTPEAAGGVLAALARAGRSVRVGFTLGHTAWARRLAAWLPRRPSCGALRIEWRFRAHHYANELETWKRRPSQGGGALSFYGIHLIALLAELGYTSVRQSCIEGRDTDDARRWEARFAGPALPDCTVLVDSDTPDRNFSVSADDFAVTLGEPFEEEQAMGPLDQRVSLLVEVCRPFLVDASPATPMWYPASVELWSAASRQADSH